MDGSLPNEMTRPRDQPLQRGDLVFLMDTTVTGIVCTDGDVGSTHIDDTRDTTDMVGVAWSDGSYSNVSPGQIAVITMPNSDMAVNFAFLMADFDPPQPDATPAIVGPNCITSAYFHLGNVIGEMACTLLYLRGNNNRPLETQDAAEFAGQIVDHLRRKCDLHHRRGMQTYSEVIKLTAAAAEWFQSELANIAEGK